jgi:hypothetical protein
MRLSLEGRAIDAERTAFVLTVIFAAMTFWFAPRLPMVDLPQHAAQVAVWHDLLMGTSKWQALLYVNYFTPYLVGYGVALLLSFVLPISAALKVSLILAYFGFVAACVALRRCLGGDRRLDWLFIPGFFGYAYALGLYTFLVALPFGVLFILLAHRYADRPTPALATVLCVADVALFFSHGLVLLFANGIGGLFLLLRGRRLLHLLAAAIPYAVVGVLCAAYALVRLQIEPVPPGEALDIFWGWDLTRWNFLVFSVDWPIAGGIDASWRLAPLVLLTLTAPLVLGARFNRQEPAAFVPFVATLLVWLLVPAEAMNTWLLYQRFAVFLLPTYALLFAAPRLAPGGILRRLWLPVLCWAILAVHVERLRAFKEESASFEDVLAAAEPGQRALCLIFDTVSPAAANLVAYLHFPLWYQAEDGGFVDFNFAGYLPQVVRYRPDRAPATYMRPTWARRRAIDFDWTRDQAGDYRYFFIRHTDPLPPAYFPEGRCEPVLRKSSGPWLLYENVNCRLAVRP